MSSRTKTPLKKIATPAKINVTAPVTASKTPQDTNKQEEQEVKIKFVLVNCD